MAGNFLLDFEFDLNVTKHKLGRIEQLSKASDVVRFRGLVATLPSADFVTYYAVSQPLLCEPTPGSPMLLKTPVI